MSAIALVRQIRAVLETSEAAFPDFLVEEFILEVSSAPEPEILVFQLEEQLHQLHGDVVDHTSLHHTQVFLAVLHHLLPILPAVSIISSWFDLVLRPALREPKLPVPAVNHAKELIVSALRKDDDRYPEKIAEFRCRLLDLYLLDAFNEGSGDDVLEWAELDDLQREKKTRWKSNLEEILLKYGQERPSVCGSVIHSMSNSFLAGLDDRNKYPFCDAFVQAAVADINQPVHIRSIVPVFCRCPR